jgi:hypothetical protein
VGENERGGVGMPGAHMQEVNWQLVDGGAELWDAVEPPFGRAPVVLVVPVPAQFGEDGQRDAL